MPFAQCLKFMRGGEKEEKVGLERSESAFAVFMKLAFELFLILAKIILMAAGKPVEEELGGASRLARGG